MKRFGRFLIRRIGQMFFQVLGIVTVIFFIVHLSPGNPAISLAGVGAKPESVKAIEAKLGLDKPIIVQYGIYLYNLARGDLGDSIYTGQPVSKDLVQRFPATLELVTVATVVCVIVGIPLGVITALRRKGLVEKAMFAYGMLSGAIPDFWFGLILVFVFFFLLGWAPPPMGRLGLVTSPPTRITGFYLVDSLIQADLNTFWLTAKHLALPVLTLVLVYMGNISKMAHSSMDEVMGSEFIDYARACGLPRSTIIRYALRNALPPVVTVVAFNYGFLLGAAVLVETVFSWGGLGEYAVQSINHSDYAPLQGFVLVAGLFMVLQFAALDVVYGLLDPRFEY
jgi:peptide/nickel transport system permease protein